VLPADNSQKKVGLPHVTCWSACRYQYVYAISLLNYLLPDHISSTSATERKCFCKQISPNFKICPCSGDENLGCCTLILCVAIPKRIIATQTLYQLGRKYSPHRIAARASRTSITDVMMNIVSALLRYFSFCMWVSICTVSVSDSRLTSLCELMFKRTEH